jgi:hypothetical protein
MIFRGIDRFSIALINTGLEPGVLVATNSKPF